MRYAGAMAAVGSGALAARQALGSGGHHEQSSPNAMGVLVDLTECIGCRLCEYSCKKANGMEAGEVSTYDDQSVMKTMRRPSPGQYTVVNKWGGTGEAPKGAAVYTKVNCFHCQHAACVSACIVGALEKTDKGAVVYDEWKCIGCRYCMVACPFGIPTYEYDNVLTPQVRKCTLCAHRTAKGELPGCVKECPRQVMVYGRRSELVALAKRKIAEHPEKYVNHIYGETEVGGTAWLYISGVPFAQAGFQEVGPEAPPELTEKIQHGVFKYWILPVGWYSFLAGACWWTGRREAAAVAEGGRKGSGGGGQGSGDGGRVVHLDVMKDGAESGGVAVMDEVETGEDAKVGRAHNRLAAGNGNRRDDHGLSGHKHETHGAAPVRRKLLTPGVWALLALVLAGLAFGLYRFIFGLAAATNLDQEHPWGLWIAMDVGSGIALAGGGFVTAALVHIFHREHYHSVARSALLTALLGYTFYVPGLLADLGRWYNLWHPTIPTMWQGNSVLFEVGLCVMIYLNVQYAEILPIICERWMGGPGKLSRLARRTHDMLEKIMPALLILGVALSTFHQSSLGNLMVIAPYKLHPLWWSPLAPLLFLLSAMMVGFPMVIFTLIFGAWCLRRRPDMKVLAPLSRYVILALAVYLAVKIGDMIWRGTYSYLGTVSLVSLAWEAEMLAGVVLPLALLSFHRVRTSSRWLGLASLLVILGVVLNRLNVFILGYSPPWSHKTYVPSLTEVMLSLGLVAALMLTYRVAVTYLPILEPERAEGAS